MNYDIIPDIHGQADKLDATLHALGWRHDGTRWTGPDSERRLVFLGDFIDRGPHNRRVLETVRALVDDGLAQAVMGNHELNALRTHHVDPAGNPFRSRTPEKLAQHASFLAEFYFEQAALRYWLDWFATLPLFLELGQLRAVHACWSASSVEHIRKVSADGRLPLADLLASARKDHELFEAVQLLTKGPEFELPRDRHHIDNRGFTRREVRLKWWLDRHDHWRATMTAPADIDLSDQPLIEAVAPHAYPANETPVVFGHYVLPGPVAIEQSNALCLDRCSTKDDPIHAYRFNAGDQAFHNHRAIVPGTPRSP